jgi:hypothetical protein
VGEHLPGIACGRLPEQFRDAASVGKKYQIEVDFQICGPVPSPGPTSHRRQ